MATIKPFRGVRYNLDKIADLSTVISQPHDRVQGLQEQYYDLSPYNVIRLIKGLEQPGDDERDNVYTRARDAYRAWVQEGVLVRDQTPAFYVLRQTFRLPDGSVRMRQALIAALELARLDEGIVLPHERTLRDSMLDRLSLLRAVAMNFSSIFMLYPGNRINELLTAATAQPPLFEAHELLEHDVVQQFWAVTDPQVLAAIAEELAPKRNLIIADGHHRYETSLAYRDEMRAQHPDAPPNAGFNYRSVALVSTDDPGLVILPTHRLIHSPTRMQGAEALERAKTYFDVTPVADRAALEAAVKAARGTPRTCFGFHDGASAVLTLRDPGVMERLLPGRALAWRTLDTAVVHELFIERVLGIDKQAVAEKNAVEFLRDPQKGYDAVSQGGADYLLLMSPTHIEQVRACSAAGGR
jgi:uncharacterized protein (DUF1015 family)